MSVERSALLAALAVWEGIITEGRAGGWTAAEIRIARTQAKAMRARLASPDNPLPVIAV